MSIVFVNIGLSLDGHMAPDGMTMENPGHNNWGAKWSALMGWILNQQHFRENKREPCRSFALTGFLMAGPPRTCAMFVSEGGQASCSRGRSGVAHR